MTDNHGGYSQEQYREAKGSENETQNQAKNLMGGESLDDMAKKAPSNDNENSAGGTGKTENKNPVNTGKKGKPDPEELKRKKQRMERIGGAICKKVSGLPYTFWSRMAGDPALQLTPEEHKELADAYFEVAQGYGAEFESPIWGVFAIIAINADLVGKRLQIPGFEATE